MKKNRVSGVINRHWNVKVSSLPMTLVKSKFVDQTQKFNKDFTCLSRFTICNSTCLYVEGLVLKKDSLLRGVSE